MKETPDEARIRRATYHLTKKARPRHRLGAWSFLVAIFQIIVGGCTLAVLVNAVHNLDAKYADPPPAHDVRPPSVSAPP